MLYSKRRPRGRLAASLQGIDALPVVLMVTPVFMLGAFWTWGEAGLLVFSAGVPMVIGGYLLLVRHKTAVAAPRDATTGLLLREGFEHHLREAFDRTSDGGLRTACFLVELDGAEGLRRQHGQAVLDDILQRSADRIVGVLRADDTVARVGDTCFAVCLTPGRHLDLENGIQVASRLHAALDEPVHLGASTLYVTCSIGFCLRSRAPGNSVDTWYQASQTALDEARQNGPGSIRVFTQEMEARRARKETLSTDAARALDRGEIQAWFQPQVSTETGYVSGFEALARWNCPTRGIVAPDAFLPALEAQGLMDRLGRTILVQSLDALRGWSAAGLVVPQVSVNLSQQDLGNPQLADHIAWELDRAGLPADRLCVEILETVVTDHPDDTVLRNIEQLHQLGCQVDLDDYGTGHASIAALRRFPVTRIKIDRSFVTHVDRDPEQQRMINAVLSMADRLDLQAVAEGVESAGEHAFLAQLGCHFVQGYGIGRPMPYSDTVEWLHQHMARLDPPPKIGRSAP